MSDTEASPGANVRRDRVRPKSRLRLSIGRHPNDVVRLAAAAVVLTLCVLLELIPAVNPVEVAIFEEIGKIPRASGPLWEGLTWVGSWIGIAAATAVALYLKRIRVGVKCLAAGALTWGLVHIMHWVLLVRPVPPQLMHDPEVRLPGGAGFVFPAGHVAIAAALAVVVAPYLNRAARNGAWALTVLVAAADVYVGGHLPLGALAGATLGWGVATLFHLVWGAPGRKTSDESVRRTLDHAGLAPVTMVPIRHHWLGPREFSVCTATGDTLRVEVVRRMHRRAGPWYKLRRLLASLDVQDEPRLSTTHHEVEHEALVTLLAERAGIHTPRVVLACEIKHGSPLLVRKQVRGRRLSTLRASQVDDDLLDAIWGQVARLADANIAHHDLRAKNILVDTFGDPWLMNFTFGQAGADTTRHVQDLAEAMVSLTSVVGVDRTVASVARALPSADLEATLGYLHPLALPRRIRRQVIEGRYLVTELREALAERIGAPIPSFRSPLRPATIAGLLLVGAAVYLLFPQLSSMSDVLKSLRHATYGWLAASVVAGLLAILMAGISMLGSSHVRLPFWPTMAVQLGAAFTGRTTPGGAGFFGINIAFLERRGMRRSRAVGVTLLNLSGTGFVAAIACVIGVFGVGVSGVLHTISIPTSWPVLAAVAGVLIVAGLLIGSPFGRRRIIRPGLEVARDLLSTLHHPVRAVQLFGGSLAYLVVSAFGLAASIAAFQPDFPLVAVLTVFVVAQTLGHLAPAPGGLGAVEAVMIAGLTAVGIAPTAAVASVLTFRLLTYWLPVLPGIAMFRYLQHRGTI